MEDKLGKVRPGVRLVFNWIGILFIISKLTWKVDILPERQIFIYIGQSKS